MRASRRWWLSFPFLLALVSIIFWGWSVSLSAIYPYDGYSFFDQIGIIQEVFPNGPADGLLKESDRIIYVDNEPYKKALENSLIFNHGKTIGDPVNLTIQRESEELQVSIILTNPPLSVVFQRVIPHLVALVFWAVGVGVLTFRTPDRAANLFFVLTQGGSITLATGATSLFGYEFVSSIFNISLWVIGPLMVHFHLYFPKPNLKLSQHKVLWINIHWKY